MRINNFIRPQISFKADNGESVAKKLKRTPTQQHLNAEENAASGSSSGEFFASPYLNSASSVDLANALRAASGVETQEPFPKITMLSGKDKKDKLEGHIVSISDSAEVREEVKAAQEVELNGGVTVNNITVGAKGITKPQVVIKEGPALDTNDNQVLQSPKIIGEINFPYAKGVVSVETEKYYAAIDPSKIYNATYINPWLQGRQTVDCPPKQ